MSKALVRVLVVDDDVNLLNALRRALRKDVELMTATGAVEGLRMLDKNGPFCVLVSDQNMPKVDGATFLAKVRESFPNVVRIMLTGNNDQETAMKAVNQAHVFSYLHKPCKADALRDAIFAAHQYHESRMLERTVLEETVAGAVKLVTDMLAITYPKDFRRSQLVQRWAVEAGKALGVDEIWELEVAALLWPMADRMLSEELRAKKYRREPLTEEETRKILESNLTASRILANVPRFSGVSRLLLAASTDGSRMVGEAGQTMASRILHILIDLVCAMKKGGREGVEAGFSELEKHSQDYDPALLAVLPDLIAQASEGQAGTERLSVELRDLCVGDLLLEDLYDGSGVLLLASGQEVTDTIAVTLARIQANGRAALRAKVARRKKARAA